MGHKSTGHEQVRPPRGGNLRGSDDSRSWSADVALMVAVVAPPVKGVELGFPLDPVPSRRHLSRPAQAWDGRWSMA
ncbi:hypothetical protein BN13_390031 [Nostocoides jenkinsii Ben 74]|uniref:Uncharacterized protein n=1 Tax=Nostocoides jenkinsii Ben 74 TaxID=1193518 RepID=A0A077MA11_9MICO|nr:hypothetical protein BN13_390031 [Tetrasphaera jenkinsii Ben 74]